jgi:hypothetical protein
MFPMHPEKIFVKLFVLREQHNFLGLQGLLTIEARSFIV